MVEDGLDDQELVVHVFAPLDGPWAEAAEQQLRAIWTRSSEQLGIDRSVGAFGLPSWLPEGRLHSGTGAPLAVAEDRTGDYQMIARRDHDILNFSLVFAAPLDTEGRRLRIGSAVPPGWREFDRWWRQLSIAGVDAFLGTAVLYQAQIPDENSVAMPRAAQWALPFRLTTEPWLPQPTPGGSDLVAWEFGSVDTDPNRILVVGAPRGRDDELSAWTWSDGGVAMPPLARYLMHAAKLRYQARVLGDGTRLRQLQRRAKDRVIGLAPVLTASGAVPAATEQIRALAADEANLVATLGDLQDIRHTIEIAEHNMRLSMPAPCPADHALAELLPQRVSDASDYLHTALERVRHMRELLAARRIGPQGAPAAPESVLTEPVPVPAATPPRGRTELRLGFAVDIAGYSRRSAPAQNDVQRRLAALVREVVRALGLELAETDREGTGDGMKVFLPLTTEIPNALPTLMRAWHELIVIDNRRSPDRMRLRASAAVGMFGPGDIGFTGETVIEIIRLLDSQPLYQALADNPDSDLEFMISGWLHEVVVEPEYPLLESFRFERRRVQTKNYDKDGWLWVR
ncbi:CATRA conflict system CASPASE/TPR repeat-associated protein [Nocardia ninae]|nr:CATRA conflict system CASPASE/TPR repeat-associated protein [Nocardia ninae]